jgi:predicted MFS family arabinose efflux permease
MAKDASDHNSPNEQASGRAYRIYVLAVLTIVFGIQHVDRQVISLVVEPIKHEFDLSDGQVGFLTSLTFSIPYTLLILPFGRLVDRFNRRNILMFALLIWSGFTFLSGFARSAVELGIARALTAGAESANNPTAWSIISDLFEKKQRTTAIGIFYTGAAIAGIVVFPAIGYVAAQWGWRAAFFVAGAPGLIFAAVVFLTVKEPVRERLPGERHGDQVPTIRDAMKFMISQPSLLLLTSAMILAGGAQASNSFWIVPFLMRAHDIPLAEAIGITSVVIALFTGIGQVVGGKTIGKLSERDIAWIGWGCAGSSLLAFIPLEIALTASSLWITVTSIAFWSFLLGMIYGPVGGTVLTLTPPRMRGLVTSSYSSSVNLIGAGIAPLLVGMLSDLHFDSDSGESLRIALQIMSVSAIGASILFFLSAGRLSGDVQRIVGADIKTERRSGNVLTVKKAMVEESQ